MQNYLNLLQQIIDHGIDGDDRTGTGTRSVFGTELRFDLQQGFPLLTTKKLHIRSIVLELLWFLRGDCNVRWLQERGVSIWNEWADANGNLGPVYGVQWRHWQTPAGNHIDQIAELMDNIKSSPESRRHLVSAWNVADVNQMNLPPCHYSFQFYIRNSALSCLFNMRSIDVFLGLPFNIASYALLTHMIAEQCELEAKELIFHGGDTHLYRNHFKQAELQLQRSPRALPQLKIHRKPASIFDYQPEDFEILNYDPHPHIKAPVAV